MTQHGSYCLRCYATGSSAKFSAPAPKTLGPVSSTPPIGKRKQGREAQMVKRMKRLRLTVREPLWLRDDKGKWSRTTWIEREFGYVEAREGVRGLLAR